jgi:hypothetical protein
VNRKPLPHPAIICGGPQLLSVIEGMEAGTYPLPPDAIWREDLPRPLAIRLAIATGATDQQIAEAPYPQPEDISYDQDARWCQDHGHTGLLTRCPICDDLLARDPRFAALVGTVHNPDGSLI